MAAISDGTVLDCRQGRRLARRQYLTVCMFKDIDEYFLTCSGDQ
jgi:hypothetical protein